MKKKARVSHTKVRYAVPGVEDPASPEMLRRVLDDILARVKVIESVARRLEAADPPAPTSDTVSPEEM